MYRSATLAERGTAWQQIIQKSISRELVQASVPGNWPNRCRSVEIGSERDRLRSVAKQNGLVKLIASPTWLCCFVSRRILKCCTWTLNWCKLPFDQRYTNLGNVAVTARLCTSDTDRGPWYKMQALGAKCHVCTPYGVGLALGPVLKSKTWKTWPSASTLPAKTGL